MPDDESEEFDPVADVWERHPVPAAFDPLADTWASINLARQIVGPVR